MIVNLTQHTMTRHLYQIQSVFIGLAVGDALGVPVEFKSREYLAANPVTTMIGYGSHRQPPGTFSDDSSLAFCLAEALALQPFSLLKVADNFINWRKRNYWTAHGSVFDIGLGTSTAPDFLARGIPPDLAGRMDESTNGNGSLMRIAPLLFYIHNKPITERYNIVKDVSSITHAHIRSVIACFYYLEFMLLVLNGVPKQQAYMDLQKTIPKFLQDLSINAQEIAIYDRLLQHDISKLQAYEILSSGYVLHTLEASIWCLLTTDSYETAVLQAVNLGNDTDTTAAVTGAVAGLLYGYQSIPSTWVQSLARLEDILDLCQRLSATTTPFTALK